LPSLYSTSGYRPGSASKGDGKEERGDKKGGGRELAPKVRLSIMNAVCGDADAQWAAVQSQWRRVLAAVAAPRELIITRCWLVGVDAMASNSTALFFFRTDYMDSLDCLLILLSIRFFTF